MNAASGGAGPGAGRRWRRRVAIALPALALVWAGSMVGVSGGWRFRLTREDGTPVAGAYVAYVYEGQRFNLVDSGVHDVRRGGLARSDGEGTVRIPARMFVKRGPLDRSPGPSVKLLYAPTLHLARPLGDARAWREGRGPAIDRVTPRGDGSGFVLSDAAGDAEAWEKSIDAVHRLASAEAYAMDVRYVLDAGSLAELVARLRSEYDGLLASHAKTARRPPPHHAYLDTLGAAERLRAEERMRKDLEDEPLVGPWMERRWAERIEAIERAVREARP